MLGQGGSVYGLLPDLKGTLKDVTQVGTVQRRDPVAKPGGAALYSFSSKK